MDHDAETQVRAGTGHIHWLLGPVGAGKSTLALQLATEQRAVFLNLDAWMATLFRADRPESGVMPWYRERTERCLQQIWQTTLAIARTRTDIVLELGLIQRAARAPFWRRLDASGLDLTVHVVDAPRDLRRERVLRRNAEQGSTFAMVVPPEIFALASDLWEPLDADECAGHDIRYIDTSTPT